MREKGIEIQRYSIRDIEKVAFVWKKGLVVARFPSWNHSFPQLCGLVGVPFYFWHLYILGHIISFWTHCDEE